MSSIREQITRAGGPPPLNVLLADRGEGKTTAALAWLAEGQPIAAYPGWTRVLLVASYDMARIRVRQLEQAGVAEARHRVHSFASWRDARGCAHDVEVCIDDLEHVLPHLPGRLTHVTINGVPWEVDR